MASYPSKSPVKLDPPPTPATALFDEFVKGRLEGGDANERYVLYRFELIDWLRLPYRSHTLFYLDRRQRLLWEY